MRQAPEGVRRGGNHLGSSQLKKLAFSQERETEKENLSSGSLSTPHISVPVLPKAFIHPSSSHLQPRLF